MCQCRHMNTCLLTVNVTTPRGGGSLFLECLAALSGGLGSGAAFLPSPSDTQVCTEVLEKILKMDLLIELIASRMNYTVFIFVLFRFALLCLKLGLIMYHGWSGTCYIDEARLTLTESLIEL